MVAQFGVLGTVQVTVDGTDLPVGGPKQRCVMGMLLLEPGRVVPTGRIAEAVWGADRPAEMTNALQAAASRLRRVLATRTEARLVGRADGYQLEVDEDQVDVHRSRRLIAAARTHVATGAEPRATQLFEQALSLWRGRPFANVDSALVQDRLVPPLSQEYLGALVESQDCALRMGHGARLIPQLSRLVEEYPFEQRLRAQLLVALYDAGRAVDALREYYRLRTVLVNELGIEPDDELRSMHQAILRGVPAGQLVRTHVPGVPAARPVVDVSSQLPQLADPVDSADAVLGREDQFRRLVAWFDESPDRPAVLAGDPGVGKTALALRVARALAERCFPDGQLYADLGADHRDPVEVVAGFLLTLGVPAADVPRRWDECVARLRDAVDGRRVLVVLDGAGEESATARLLTAVDGCGVLVTTSGTVPELAGALRVRLDGLDPRSSVAALAAIVGADRIDAEPAAAEVVRLCAYNARAIGLVGAALRMGPDRGLAEVADRLTELRGTDTVLHSGTAIGYERQSPTVRRLFRLLDLFDLPPLPLPSLALVFGMTEQEAERTVGLLSRARLVEALGGVDGPRYRIPGGIRTFASRHPDLDVDDTELISHAGRVVRSWLSTVGAPSHQDQPSS